MKTTKYVREIPILFLVVFVCSLRALAVELPSPTETIAPQVAQTDLLHLGSQLQSTRFDCSHLVHSLYESVGLHYPYATSRAVYRGIEEFQRVLQPDSGDLIVWPGHMGIVVDPSRHSFLSALRRRVKTSLYTSEYWRRRGIPRFFRFALSVKTPKE